MPLTVYQPAPPLNQYIECFWYINAQIPYTCEKILPTNTVELIINFGDDFQLRETTDSAEFRTMRKAWLVGLQTKYLVNEITGHSHMLGIRFKPWGIAPFFQMPAREVQNQVVKMDAIWQYLIDDMRDALYDKVSLAEKFAFLEAFFLVRYQPDTHQLLPIQFAMHELSKVQQKLSIRDLSTTIGMSQKHLAHQFKKFVGVSPKMMARLYRFQHTLTTINPAEDIDWTGLALDSLYYDQSHFNKDFLAFTGFTPTAYVDMRRGIMRDFNEEDATHFVPIG